jgi:hypothetical protein
MAGLPRPAAEVSDPHAGADFRPAGLPPHCARVRFEIQSYRLVFVFHQIAIEGHTDSHLKEGFEAEAPMRALKPHNGMELPEDAQIAPFK